MKTKSKLRGGPNRGQGRKPLSNESKSVVVNTSMTEAQREKFKRLGGSAWLRAQIDNATIAKDATVADTNDCHYAPIHAPAP